MMAPTLFRVNLAANAYNRYPGELVTFFLRFITPNIPAAQLQISMPRTLKIESYRLPQDIPVSLPALTELDQDLILLIPLVPYFVANQEYEITIETRIHPFYFDHYMRVDASILDDTSTIQASESVQIAIAGKGKYLGYLPEIYGADDFTSRFLMMFESFWKPITLQIDQVENYFDPDLTPNEFIPWLSSWVGIPVDTDLPVSRMRSLIRRSMYFYQFRGTSAALKSMLELYTGGNATILEHRAKNFVVGSEASLGPTTALGKENKPDSVKVSLVVPRSELTRMNITEEMYQRKMTHIIQNLIPAHSDLDVKCEFASEKN